MEGRARVELAERESKDFFHAITAQKFPGRLIGSAATQEAGALSLPSTTISFRESTTQTRHGRRHKQTYPVFTHPSSRWMLITASCLVIKDLFAAMEEKNGGKLMPDQISRASLKLSEMLGNPDPREVTQNEKGQVRRFPLPPSGVHVVSDID